LESTDGLDVRSPPRWRNYITVQNGIGPRSRIWEGCAVSRIDQDACGGSQIAPRRYRRMKCGGSELLAAQRQGRVDANSADCRRHGRQQCGRENDGDRQHQGYRVGRRHLLEQRDDVSHRSHTELRAATAVARAVCRAIRAGPSIYTDGIQRCQSSRGSGGYFWLTALGEGRLEPGLRFRRKGTMHDGSAILRNVGQNLLPGDLSEQHE